MAQDELPTKKAELVDERWPELLSSSAAGRVERFRSAFTLSMHFRRGPQWEAIRVFREAWQIRSHVSAPRIAAEAASMPIFFPENLPGDAPPSPFAHYQPDHPSDYGAYPFGLFPDLGEDDRYDEDDHVHTAWRRDLKCLYDHLVPEDCRWYGPTPEAAWLAFLSLVVLHDPPRDQLLGYANSTQLIDLPPSHHLDENSPDLETAKQAMIHAPLLKVRDDRAVGRAWVDFYEDVFSRLASKLGQTHNIDLKKMRDELIASEPDIVTGHKARMGAVSSNFAISIDDYTSAMDVQNAYKLIREANPSAYTNEGRPSRNPLVCVQCAILHDEFHWSQKQIAERFDWTLQYPFGQKPRSETARLNINEGRRIIQENSNP